MTSEQKVNIFLTFDYELPLGGWRISPENALIHPTERVLQTCKKLDVPAIFFVDVLSAMQLIRWGETALESVMRRQLQISVGRGHDLQLHLHPHWLTSTYKDRQYTPSKDFRLADFLPYRIENMIDSGIRYLRGVGRSVDPDYNCLAFRAGGYNVENSKVIFSALQTRRIWIDSSMCDGYYYASDCSTVDFRDLPDLPNWYFRNGNIRNPVKGGIYEIPVAGKPKSLLELPSFVKRTLHPGRQPEVRGRTMHEGSRLSLQARWRKAMSARMLSFDNYALSTGFLLGILKYHLNRFPEYGEINLAVVSHPKSMDTYNFFLMEDFIASVRRIYGEQVRFMTFQQFAREKWENRWKKNT